MNYTLPYPIKVFNIKQHWKRRQKRQRCVIRISLHFLRMVRGLQTLRNLELSGTGRWRLCEQLSYIDNTEHDHGANYNSKNIRKTIPHERLSAFTLLYNHVHAHSGIGNNSYAQYSRETLKRKYRYETICNACILLSTL